MIPSASIHPLASSEIEEAARFYEQQTRGLGDRFADELTTAFEQILLFPQAASLVGRSVRKKALLRFPYSVIYLVRDDQIVIIAVAHQKRTPAYWRDRLRT